MLSLYGFIKEELIKQDKLPDKYRDVVYSTESYCINPDGIIDHWVVYQAELNGKSSHEISDGWKVYASPNTSLHNSVMVLCAESYPEYPRAQAMHPNSYIRFKTPQKGILTSYLTTQYADDRSYNRICNDWEIIGFNSEKDLLNLENGTVLSHDGWDAKYQNGKTKTVSVAGNNKPFQYYAIHMINNFYNGALENGSTYSYCSMGSTKFYMRMPVATCINEDGVISSTSGGNGWKIYDKSTGYGEVWNALNSKASPSYPRWQVIYTGVSLPSDDYNYYAYLKTPEKCKITSYSTTVAYDESSSSPSKLRGRVCSHWQLVGYDSEDDMLNLRNGYALSENYWFATPVAGNTKRVFIKNTKKFQYYTLRMVKKYAGNAATDSTQRYNACSIGSTKFYVN